MVDRSFVYFGDVCDIDKMVRHYRAMAHRQPHKIAFWGTLLRTAIREFRTQAALARRMAA